MIVFELILAIQLSSWCTPWNSKLESCTHGSFSRTMRRPKKNFVQLFSMYYVCKLRGKVANHDLAKLVFNQTAIIFWIFKITPAQFLCLVANTIRHCLNTKSICIEILHKAWRRASLASFYVKVCIFLLNISLICFVAYIFWIYC